MQIKIPDGSRFDLVVQVRQESGHGEPRVDDVFHEKHVLAGQGAYVDVGDLHVAGAAGALI